MKSEQDTQAIEGKVPSSHYTEIQQLARQHKLGKLHSSYTRSATSSSRILINAIIWFAIGLVGLFFLIDAVRKIMTSETLSDPPTLRSIGAIGVISLILLFGCLLQGWRNLREYHNRNREQVHIFEDGFVFLEGHEYSHVLRWDTIESLLRGTLDPKHPKNVAQDNLLIETDKGTTLVFEPKVHQRMEACDIIERNYTDYRRPGMLELYRLGEDLEFGNLIVNQTGVNYLHAQTKEEEVLPWEALTSIEVGKTYTRILTDKDGATPWFEELTADIDNALILKELLPIIQPK